MRASKHFCDICEVFRSFQVFHFSIQVLHNSWVNGNVATVSYSSLRYSPLPLYFYSILLRDACTQRLQMSKNNIILSLCACVCFFVPRRPTPPAWTTWWRVWSPTRCTSSPSWWPRAVAPAHGAWRHRAPPTRPVRVHHTIHSHTHTHTLKHTHRHTPLVPRSRFRVTCRSLQPRLKGRTQARTMTLCL